MTPLRGRLVSAAFAQAVLRTLRGFEAAPQPVRRDLERWAERRHEAFGPASSPRSLADGLIVPLLRLLGFTQILRTELPEAIRLDASREGGLTVPVVVGGWSNDLQAGRRAAVLSAISTDGRWSIAANGYAIRIFDAHRTWAREYLELEFDALAQHAEAQDICWSLIRAVSITAVPSLLEAAAARSAEYGEHVCRALGDGVLASMRCLVGAMAAREAPADRLFEQSLTVVYRILFLLFAESRALVPVWHPVYRDRYTIESIVTCLVAGRRYRGVWSAIQAISRLAHSGCAIGELRVTAFNGRLFSPTHAPAFEHTRLHDDLVSEAVLAVATTSSRQGRTRIGFRDLDVEQLGAVYEHVLEYQPAGDGQSRLTRNRDGRQASGTFYTPRQVTSFLVRQTLAPLVYNRSAEDILALRVLDPAMGSGAFLVAACRFLARAAEEALIREGRWHPGDITSIDRAMLRREIAQRCLFGVDVNSVAVQLARLSLWLTTLASDKPLTFLDHHLIAGNSLIGATFDDVRRQPGGGRQTRARAGQLPLFDETGLETTLRDATRVREELARVPDDSAAVVHEKERQLASMDGGDSPLRRWRRVLDLWCAGWFGAGQTSVDRGLFAELTSCILEGRCGLPERTSRQLLDDSDAVARRHLFLHWPLAFPEVLDPSSATTSAPGFDAVLGNPPWDMVRGDSGADGVRDARREDARHLTTFAGQSGVYRIECQAHLNRYVLFLERALQLTRPGGRIGLVLPAGIASDVSMAPVRRFLFDRAAVDTITGLDNRAGIFPIHRSVRFVLLSCTTAQPTREIACRFRISDPEVLDSETPQGGASNPIALSRAFLARASGADDLGIPDLATPHDLRILERVTSSVPPAGEADGWGLRFGRELNASDDRTLFDPATGRECVRPVVEGKQVEPFRVSLDKVRYELRDPSTSRVPRRARLAYRDVAGATNRLTLIAAIVPARAVTTHTLFCLKTLLPLDAQQVLCALFNSFVANYLIRLRVSTHVTAALVSRLRLPLVVRGSYEFDRLATLTASLATATAPESTPEYVELQAVVARLYRLTASDFEHILSTFPLIAAEVREASLARFNDLH